MEPAEPRARPTVTWLHLGAARRSAPKQARPAQAVVGPQQPMSDSGHRQPPFNNSIDAADLMWLHPTAAKETEQQAAQKTDSESDCPA